MRVCARFEFPRAEELSASILGVCDVQGGVVFQNTYCACPRVFHFAYFRSLNIIYLFTAIGLLPGGSGYFTCKQNLKFFTIKFKPGGLHEKHVVATWNLGNHLSICL